MTDQEINIAISELVDIPGQALTRNYCTDLIAMHEAEDKILWGDAATWNRYNAELGKLSSSLAPALHATARQRAEAFLRTVGKWKE